MYLGICTSNNSIGTKEFDSLTDATVWMYGTAMYNLRWDCDCMKDTEHEEGKIQFYGAGTFVVEDDDSEMGEGVMGKDSFVYDAVYGNSFAIKIVDLDAC